MLAPLRDATLDATLRAGFGTTASVFRHDLAGRPDLTVDALAAVAGTLPAPWVLAHEAQHSPHEGRGTEPPRAAGSITALISDIAHTHASIRIYNLERSAEYRLLAESLQPAIDRFVGPREGGVEAVNLGAFVASPGAVTAAHPDRHHNFLLQVQGRKEIWIEDDANARAHHVRVLDYLRCPSAGVAVLPPARGFVLEPGDAVYIPPYAFHWTRLFDEPGVALSIGFSTPGTLRLGDAHEFDLRLRRFGWRPRPTRAGSATGKVKARLGSACARRSANRLARSVTVKQSQEGHDGR